MSAVEQAITEHRQRIADCQALFEEAIKRQVAARSQIENPMDRLTDMQIINIGLQTLLRNGYTEQEIAEAMIGRKQGRRR
jgi:hypothetical protein